MSYEFTYNQEIGHQGQSLIPHFPGGKSGVTIGPGYDMGGRSSEQIYADLTRVGVEPRIAESLAQAAHKTGPEASVWIGQHGGLYITETQQKALFDQILVPEYEERMQEQLEHFAQNHENITAEMIDVAQLSPQQKHILFDYTYNAGLGEFPNMVTAVLKQDWPEVSAQYERFAGGEPLHYRNEMFYHAFLSPDAFETFAHQETAPEIQQIEQLLDDIATDDWHHNPSPPHHDNDQDLDQLLDQSHW